MKWSVKVLYGFTQLLGAALLILAGIPIFFAYPNSDGPNSGPANTWELVRMISYESSGMFLICGIGLLAVSVLIVRGQKR